MINRISVQKVYAVADGAAVQLYERAALKNDFQDICQALSDAASTRSASSGYSRTTVGFGIRRDQQSAHASSDAPLKLNLAHTLRC